MLHTYIVLQKRIHVSALLSASLLLVLSSLAFFPIASSYSSTLAAPAPSETTLSMTAESINLNLSVDNANGTFNASDPANLTVATNNYTGYTLSLLASSNDADATKLVNGENSISSISSVSSADDFNVGNWGIKPSKVNSAANNSYIPAPTAAGTTLDTTNGANSNANSYTISLAAKADYTLPAGRYSNTFLLAATANPVGYTINYSAGTEDTVANMPTMQSGNLGETDVTISANIPTRAGYTFNNWCDDTINTTDGISTCTGTTYSPSDPFTTSMQTTNILNLTAMWNRTFILNFDANEGTGTMPSQTITGNSASINENTFTRDGYDFTGWNTLANGTGTAYTSGAVYTVPATGTSQTLYAQWEENVYTFDQAFAAAGKSKVTVGGEQYYKMQDMDAKICNRVSREQETRLVDVRDNTIYSVGKLKDARCWLLDNLALDVISSSVQANLSPDNTNATQEAITNFISGGNPDNNAGWSNTAVSTISSIDLYGQPRVNTTSKNTSRSTLANPEDPLEAANDWKYGVYYNYCAAFIGTYCYEKNQGVDASETFAIDAVQDICPAGWRMPTGGAISSAGTTAGGGEYQNLYSFYSSITGEGDQYTSFRMAFHLPLSGYIQSGSANLQGKIVYLRSSTFFNDNAMYGLYANVSSIDPLSGINRAVGFSVRCIARDGNEPDTVNGAFAAAGKTTVEIDGEEYYKMQDMTDSICGKIRVGQEGRLVDVRDNKVYWILKAKDNHCWMTQNLDLDLDSSKTYTPDDTDITANWTPTRSTINVTNNAISGWVNDYYTPYSLNTGDWYWTDTWYPMSECPNDGSTYVKSCKYYAGSDNGKFSTSPYTGNGEHGHVGNHYNWPAAIAMNNANGYSASTSNNLANSPQTSICPKGWRLPKIVDDSGAVVNNEFAYLIDKYNALVSSGTERDRALTAGPFYFVRGGRANSNNLPTAGTYAQYWSSTVYSDTSANGFAFNSGQISPDDVGNKAAGWSVRCIAR